MTAPIASAYDAAAPAWRRGPARVYSRLAAALLDLAPVPVSGATVLDAGAGTGVAGAVALRRGAARAVAVDLAPGMLPRAPALAAVADLARLPFGDGSFALAVAAFSLGHVPDPGAAVRELRRVAPALVASAFAPGWAHPAQAAVDAALADLGFEVPEWYRTLKTESEPQVGEPDALARLATAAGYRSVRVEVVEVETGLSSAADLAAWRLGMAHLAPYVAGLPPDDREDVRRTAEAAVEGMPPLVVRMLALAAG